jgi:hypothetical protein
MNSYKEIMITRSVIDDLFQIGKEQINKVNPKETKINHLFNDEIESIIYIHINNVLKLQRNFNNKTIFAEVILRFYIHNQLPYFINRWGFQGLDNYNINNC